MIIAQLPSYVPCDEGLRKAHLRTQMSPALDSIVCLPATSGSGQCCHLSAAACSLTWMVVVVLSKSHSLISQVPSIPSSHCYWVGSCSGSVSLCPLSPGSLTTWQTGHSLSVWTVSSLMCWWVVLECLRALCSLPSCSPYTYIFSTTQSHVTYRSCLMTAVVGCICGGCKENYRWLLEWAGMNYLLLNVDKIKEMAVDFRATADTSWGVLERKTLNQLLLIMDNPDHPLHHLLDRRVFS